MEFKKVENRRRIRQEELAKAFLDETLHDSVPRKTVRELACAVLEMAAALRRRLRNANMIKGSIQWAVEQREAGHTVINRRGLSFLAPWDSKEKRCNSIEALEEGDWNSSTRMTPLDGWEIYKDER